MYPEITDINKNSGCIDGKCGRYTFSAKIFNEPSSYGIDEGRVSKLLILNEEDRLVVVYDRGWDIPVKNEDEKCFNLIMDLLKNIYI